MGKHSTLFVLFVLLVAERGRAQANPAESAIADNGNGHESPEKSTDRLASICPCIIADKCSSPYDKAADSPDAVPACTEYGTVRCCSGPLKTAESEPIEDEDIADDIGIDSLNPKELTQEDHISSSNEEIEDLDVDKELLAIQPKTEDDENPSGGAETVIETPKELLTDENETDETIEAAAVQPGSPVPEIQNFKHAIPDIIYSQVDPFLLEPVLEQDPDVVQSQSGGNSANFYYVPLSGRQAKELNKPLVRVPMVVYPPPTSRLFTGPMQRRDGYQPVPVQNYQQNEAVRLSKPLQVQSQQRPATARDNFVLKVYGKPQQPNQKLFLKDLVDVSYSPPLQVPQQRADPVPEYPGYPTEVQHQRQPVQHVIERQPAFPQSTYQTSIPATLLQEHPQLQQQPNVEYAPMDQNGGIHHKLAAQRPVYTQVELAPTQERPSYQRPLAAHNFRPINFFNQPTAWSSPSDQFYEQVPSQQSSTNTQMIRPQAEMVDESSEYHEVEETESAAPNGEYQSEDDVEPVYEETESPLPQSDQNYQLPSTASGQQPPQLQIVVAESQSSPSYEDQLQIPVPYDQGPPTQATNFEVSTASTASPVIPYEVPTGAEIKTEASSVSQVPADDYRPQDEAAKAIEEPTPQQQMNVEEIYDSQGLGMRSNQKLELAILEPIVPGPVQVAGWARKLPTPPRYELGFRPIVGPITANPAAKQPVAYDTLFRHTVETLPSYKQPVPVKMALKQRPYENNAPLYTVDQSNSGNNANPRYPRNEVRYVDKSWREQKVLRRRFNDQH